MPNDRGSKGPSLEDDILHLAADKAQSYVRGIPERRGAPTESALAALAELHEPFPASPGDPGEVIARLDQMGSGATEASTGGRYFGFVNGESVPAPFADHWLAGARKQ